MDLKERIETLLRTEVGPSLDLDGSAIEVLEVTDGIAVMRLGAVCASCPATLHVVVQGIEQELKKHVPELEYIEATL